MYQAVTQNIEVTVTPRFMPEESTPKERRFFWAYTVEIANHGDRAVQLLSRHWQITDGRGQMHEVKGSGVVGEQPILAPGDRFSYTSGCPLDTPDGIMVGTYQMVDDDGVSFSVDIPAFPLDSPHVRKVLN